MTQILFCAEHYMSNREAVEKLIQQAFPAPKYSMMSLVVHPDRVATQVHEFFIANSNPTALFFYWDCLHKRIEESYIWHPLFDKCKAVAFLNVQQEEAAVVGYWNNAWRRQQVYRIVTLDPSQQSLSPEQQNALLEVCNVEVKNSLGRSHYYIFGLLALAALALIGLLFQQRDKIFRHII